MLRKLEPQKPLVMQLILIFGIMCNEFCLQLVLLSFYYLGCICYYVIWRIQSDVLYNLTHDRQSVKLTLYIAEHDPPTLKDP